MYGGMLVFACNYRLAEQRHGHKVSPRKSRHHHHHHQSRHSHRHSNRHKTSPSSSSTSSKADKSYRSRSAERSSPYERETSDQQRSQRSVPVVKVERLSTGLDNSLIVSNANHPHDKRKISLKEVYKEPKRELILANSDLCKQDTLPVADGVVQNHRAADDSELAISNSTVQLINIHVPDSNAIKLEKDADSEYGSSIDTKSLSAVSAVPQLDNFSKHSGDFIECDIQVTSGPDVGQMQAAILNAKSHLQAVVVGSKTAAHSVAASDLVDISEANNYGRSYDFVPETNYERVPVVHLPDPVTTQQQSVKSLSSHVIDGNVQQLQASSCNDVFAVHGIPETFDAQDSEELVAKFEKMENDLKNNKTSRYHLTSDDNFDSVDPSIQEKLEGDLQNLDSKAHLFQIDNRSSTPVLHIPDSPKGGGGAQSSSPLSHLLAQALTPPPAVGVVHLNGAPVSAAAAAASPMVHAAKANSRPPSRTNNNSKSRPPSRQNASCPATPIKIEPWSAGFSSSSSSAAGQQLNSQTFTVMNCIPDCDIKQEVVMPATAAAATTTTALATALSTCSLFTSPAKNTASSLFAQPEMIVAVKPEVSSSLPAAAVQRSLSVPAASSGNVVVSSSSSLSSSHNSALLASLSPAKKHYTKDPKSIPCKGVCDMSSIMMYSTRHLLCIKLPLKHV